MTGTFPSAGLACRMDHPSKETFCRSQTDRSEIASALPGRVSRNAHKPNLQTFALLEPIQNMSILPDVAEELEHVWKQQGVLRSKALDLLTAKAPTPPQIWGRITLRHADADSGLVPKRLKLQSPIPTHSVSTRGQCLPMTSSSDLTRSAAGRSATLVTRDADRQCMKS